MEFWYCGWCKNGPMAIKLSEVCFSCARIRDASATYGSSDRIESSKAAGSKVRKEGSSPSVTGATPIQNPSPDETLISQSRRPSEQSESKDYSSQCADERRVDIAYDSGLREFGSIENVSAETADSGNLPAPLPFSTSAHPSAPSHTAAGLPTAPPKRKAFSVPYISPTVEVNPTAPSPLLHEGYSAGRFRPSQYQIEHTYRGYAPIQIEPGQTEAMIQARESPAHYRNEKFQPYIWQPRSEYCVNPKSSNYSPADLSKVDVVRNLSSNMSPQDQHFNGTFRMLIHLPSSGAAQSIVYLDLGADLNVISNRIVEDLGLTKDEYKGVAPRSRGRIREPEWQVTLDWQCGEFYRKHTSTFAVLATEYSEEFNIILGRKTIKEASLNDKVFLELAGLQENIAIIKPSTAHDEDSEDGIESLPSLTSGITPSSSASQDELQRSAADVFSDFLLEDGSLIPVFRQAMEKVDATRLERNFARLLGTFALELRADAENAVEFSAVQFIRARAKHIAKCVGFRLDPAREAASQEWRKLLETTVDRAEILESYLQGLDTKQVEKLSDHPSDTSNADSDESGSHFQADLSNQNLQHVKNFILKSTAFKDLCKRFHDFVHQGKANISVPNTGLAVNRTADLPAEKMAADVRISSSSESESVSSSDVSSGDVNDQSHGVLFRGTYILRHILFCIELTSQFLGISRPPISEGYRRVEWTCLCGSRLYDDFKDVVVGGLDGLQSFLNDHDSPRHQSDGLSDGRDQLKEVAFQAALSKPSTHLSVTEPNNADPSMREGNQAQGLRRRRPNGSEISHTHNNGSSTWVLPIYERGRHRTVVRHIPVQADTSDELLLTTLKGQYLATSSRFRRFLTMRAVKKISYVKFVHVPREPDIHKYDDWPSSKYSPPWIYKGIHTKKKRFPLVGHNFLLHLWHNPSHSDPETYRPKLRDRITTGLHRLSRIRSFIQSCVSTVKLAHKKRTDATTQDAGRTEDSQDMELGATHSSATTDIHASTTHEDFGPHWCYVTLRTPKKMGDQLKADDEDPPEAWGLYFEEGFQVHHAFFIVLVLYIIASLGFAIYWCEQYGLVGPSTGSGAFAVASWMVGLASLVVTIWFKWAD